MYPKPKPVVIPGVPNWLGSVTKVAKQGFEVYNLVKNFIPGGSKAGAGNVPGGPNAGQSELIELAGDWKEQAKETALGLGKKLLDDMEKSESEGTANYQSRLKIWKAALNMCNEDKQSFIKESKSTLDTIKMMSQPVQFSVEATEFTLSDALNQYNADIGTIEMGTVSDADLASNKERLGAFTAEVNTNIESA